MARATMHAHALTQRRMQAHDRPDTAAPGTPLNWEALLNYEAAKQLLADMPQQLQPQPQHAQHTQQQGASPASPSLTAPACTRLTDSLLQAAPHWTCAAANTSPTSTNSHGAHDDSYPTGMAMDTTAARASEAPLRTSEAPVRLASGAHVALLLLAVSLSLGSASPASLRATARLLLQFTAAASPCDKAAPGLAPGASAADHAARSSAVSARTVSTAAWCQCARLLATAGEHDAPDHPASQLIEALRDAARAAQPGAMQALAGPVLATWPFLGSNIQDEALWVLVRGLTSRCLGTAALTIDMLRSIAHMVRSCAVRMPKFMQSIARVTRDTTL